MAEFSIQEKINSYLTSHSEMKGKSEAVILSAMQKEGIVTQAEIDSAKSTSAFGYGFTAAGEVGLTVEKTAQKTTTAGNNNLYTSTVLPKELPLKEAQEECINILYDSLTKAQACYDSLDYGLINSTYDNAKELFGSKHTKFKLKQSIDDERASCAFLAEAHNGKLTKREYYEKNLERLKDMLIAHIKEYGYTGAAELDAPNSAYFADEKALDAIIEKYIQQKIDSIQDFESIKNMQTELLHSDEEQSTAFAKRAIQEAIDLDALTNGPEKNVPKLDIRPNRKIPPEFDTTESISFAETYQLETGNTFSAKKIENYMVTEAKLNLIEEQNNKLFVVGQMLDDISAISENKLNEKLDKFSQLMTQYYSLNPGLAKQELGQIISDKELPLHVLVDNEGNVQVAVESIENIENGAHLETLMRGFEEKQKEKFDALVASQGGLDGLITEYKTEFDNILGFHRAENMSKILESDDMAAKLQEVCGGATTAGMIMSVGGAVLCFVPRMQGVGAALVSVGGKMAIGGMVAQSAVGYTEGLTRDERNPDEISRLNKEAIMNIGGFVIGAGAGKLATKTFCKIVSKELSTAFSEQINNGKPGEALKVIFKNPEYLGQVAKATGAKLGTDFVISYAGDLAMMGILDTEDTWETLLRANLIGVVVGSANEVSAVTTKNFGNIPKVKQKGAENNGVAASLDAPKVVERDALDANGVRNRVHQKINQLYVRLQSIDGKYADAAADRIDMSTPPKVFEVLDATPEELAKFIEANSKDVEFADGVVQRMVVFGNSMYTPEELKRQVIHLRNMREFLDTQSIPTKMTVHRSDSYSVMENVNINGRSLSEIMQDAVKNNNVDEVLKMLNDGEIDVKYNNFIGTSLRKIDWNDTQIQWEVNVPKGSKGAYIEEMTKENIPEEKEFLLQAGSTFKIKGAEFKDGKWYIKADLVQEAEPKVKPQGEAKVEVKADKTETVNSKMPGASDFLTGTKREIVNRALYSLFNDDIQMKAFLDRTGCYEYDQMLVIFKNMRATGVDPITGKKIGMFSFKKTVESRLKETFNFTEDINLTIKEHFHISDNQYECVFINRLKKKNYQDALIAVMKDPVLSKLDLNDQGLLQCLTLDNIGILKRLVECKGMQSGRNKVDTYRIMRLLHHTDASKQREFLNERIDKGEFDKYNPLKIDYIEHVLFRITDDNFEYAKDFYEKYYDQSSKRLLGDFFDHFINVNDNNIAFARELLKIKDSVPEYEKFLILTAGRLGRLTGSERVELTKLISNLDPDMKKLLKKHGFNIENLKDKLTAKRASIDISKGQQERFLKRIIANNDPKVNKLLKEFDFAQFKDSGLPLKYNRSDFIKNVKDVIKALPAKDQTAILEHFGLDMNFDGLMNNKMMKCESKEVQIAADKVLKEIEAFTVKNEVMIADKEVKAILDGLVQGMPEFTSIIGKPQHGTHAYSVDIHMLKVLQSAMNNPQYEKLSDRSKTIVKFTALLHDIGKRTGVVDKGHQRVSAEYMFSVLDKFNLSDDITKDIIDMVDNHHWFEGYNTGKIDASYIAAMFRGKESFEIAQILAKADLESVNETFHLDITDNTTQAEFDRFFEDRMIEVRNKIDVMRKLSPALMNTGYMRKGQNFPTQKVVIDGQEVELKVLNLNDLPEGALLEEYGFAPGTTKETAMFNLHMTSDLETTYQLLTGPGRLQNNHPVISSSIVRVSDIDNRSGSLSHDSGKGTISGGVLLDIRNEDIVMSGNSSFSSTGTHKSLQNSYKSMFSDAGGGNTDNRVLLRNKFAQLLHDKTGIDLTVGEYKAIFEELMGKKYTSQITEDIVIGDKVIKAEDCKAALTEAREELFTVNEYDSYQSRTQSNGGSNETTQIDPIPIGLLQKVHSIEECSPEFLKFAKEHNLPIILISRESKADIDIVSDAPVKNTAQEENLTTQKTTEQLKYTNKDGETKEFILEKQYETKHDGNVTSVDITYTVRAADGTEVGNWTGTVHTSETESYIQGKWIHSNLSGVNTKGLGTKLKDLIKQEAQKNNCSEIRIVAGLESHTFHNKMGYTCDITDAHVGMMLDVLHVIKKKGECPEFNERIDKVIESKDKQEINLLLDDLLTFANNNELTSRDIGISHINIPMKYTIEAEGKPTIKHDSKIEIKPENGSVLKSEEYLEDDFPAVFEGSQVPMHHKLNALNTVYRVAYLAATSGKPVSADDMLDFKTGLPKMLEIDREFAKLPPLEKNIVVWRGRSENPVIERLNDDFRIIDNAKVGDIIVPDVAYSYAAFERRLASNWSSSFGERTMMLEIRLPQGAKVSRNLEHGGEVVIPRNAEYRLLSKTIKDNHIEVELEYILPKNDNVAEIEELMQRHNLEPEKTEVKSEETKISDSEIIGENNPKVLELKVLLADNPEKLERTLKACQKDGQYVESSLDEMLSFIKDGVPQDDEVRAFDPSGAQVREDMRSSMLSNSRLADKDFELKQMDDSKKPQLVEGSKYYDLGTPKLNKKTGEMVLIFENLRDAADMNGLRGKNPLSGNKEGALKFKLSKLKNGGIRTIVDFRAKGECNAVALKILKELGMEYVNFPIEDAHWDLDTVKAIGEYISAVNKGDFFAGCANGQARTDLGMAINYIFNPSAENVPQFYYGSESSTRVSVKSNIQQILKVVQENPQLLKNWGWNSYDAFLGEFNKRFEMLTNSIAGGNN